MIVRDGRRLIIVPRHLLALVHGDKSHTPKIADRDPIDCFRPRSG